MTGYKRQYESSIGGQTDRQKLKGKNLYNDAAICNQTTSQTRRPSGTWCKLSLENKNTDHFPPDFSLSIGIHYVKTDCIMIKVDSTTTNALHTCNNMVIQRLQND